MISKKFSCTEARFQPQWQGICYQFQKDYLYLWLYIILPSAKTWQWKEPWDGLDCLRGHSYDLQGSIVPETGTWMRFLLKGDCVRESSWVKAGRLLCLRFLLGNGSGSPMGFPSPQLVRMRQSSEFAANLSFFLSLANDQILKSTIIFPEIMITPKEKIKGRGRKQSRDRTWPI